MDLKTFLMCTMVLLALVSQLESKPAGMHVDCNKGCGGFLAQKSFRSARSIMGVIGGDGEAGGVLVDGRDDGNYADGVRNEEK